jgi:hypothetical protein
VGTGWLKKERRDVGVIDQVTGHTGPRSAMKRVSAPGLKRSSAPVKHGDGRLADHPILFCFSRRVAEKMARQPDSLQPGACFLAAAVGCRLTGC